MFPRFPTKVVALTLLLALTGFVSVSGDEAVCCEQRLPANVLFFARIRNFDSFLQRAEGSYWGQRLTGGT
ncbi:MAG: hypothetical protein NT069_03935 [Planctomycetota bacterium]|nr:hypothetical protein [Planctomycetota bacterium]